MAKKIQKSSKLFFLNLLLKKLTDFTKEKNETIADVTKLIKNIWYFLSFVSPPNRIVCLHLAR